MPSKPPISALLKVLLILFFLSFGIVFIAEILLDSPSGFALFFWLLLFVSYYRSHHNPRDIPATLTLIIVIIIAIMTKQMNLPIGGLPWLMFEGFIIALAVTYASFTIFPGDEHDILADDMNDDAIATNTPLIAFKATAMGLTIAVLIATGSTQSMLIAMTISSMIKIPAPHHHRLFSQHRLMTTSIGVLFTIPVMLLYMFSAPTWVVIGVAIFCSIQLACFAIRRQCRLSIYQLLFTNFTVLTYQIIKNHGADSFSAELMRLVSIATAIAIAVLILNLTKTRSSINPPL
jgi:hypothetical protein